jgi:integrase
MAKDLPMATTKLILKTEKENKKGKIPLFLRIIQDRKPSYISLGVYLKQSEWNDEEKKVKKSHPNSTRLNAFIAKKVAEAEAKMVELQTKQKRPSGKKIKTEIMGGAAVNFFEFTKAHQEAIEKAGHINMAKRIKSIQEKLKTYLGHENLFLTDIDVEFLVKFNDYLAGTLKNKTNTITSNMKLIRRMLNDAIRQGKMNRNDYPFYSYRLKNEPTKRDYLAEDELLAIEKLALEPGSRLAEVRDMYVFSAYAGGIRVSDLLLLRWKNFDGERQHFKVLKTGKELHIKLPEKALEILKKYQTAERKPDSLIFSILRSNIDFDNPKQVTGAISSATAQINERLKIIANKAEVEKKISFHTARHTFATRALRKGIRIEYVSKLLGHATIKETQVYAKIVDEELDNAMDVFNEKKVVPRKRVAKKTGTSNKPIATRKK